MIIATNISMSVYVMKLFTIPSLFKKQTSTHPKNQIVITAMPAVFIPVNCFSKNLKPNILSNNLKKETRNNNLMTNNNEKRIISFTNSSVVFSVKKRIDSEFSRSIAEYQVKLRNIITQKTGSMILRFSFLTLFLIIIEEIIPERKVIKTLKITI